MLNQFSIFIPEISLALIAMMMQIFAVFTRKSMRHIAFITIILTSLLVGYLIFVPTEYGYYEGSFLSSSVIDFFKALILGMTIMNLVIYRDHIKITHKGLKMEFVTIMLLSTLGIFISISARDFLLLFCGLELQALSGYALTAFNTKNEKSSEAGLKYFILGALMSGIMLLGISFLYGFSGSIKFLEIKVMMSDEPVIGLVVGAALVMTSILFKLSAAPVHIWTPDVYEGAPISATSYFATTQKLGMLLVLINIVDGVIDDYWIISGGLLKLVAILSMIVGSLGAIGQKSLKRLMAYSSILNIGYVLIAISLHSIEGNNSGYVYMLIYAIGAIGFFASIIALFGSKADEASFDDLRGIAKKRKALAAVIAILMFSMIGLPPFAGFFAKYYIFMNALQKGELLLVCVAIITSVIAAFYYLKVIKFMYFMDHQSNIESIGTHKGLWLVTTISATFTIFFFTFANNYIV